MSTQENTTEREPDRLRWWGQTWRVLAALALGGVFWLITSTLIFPDSGAEPGLAQGFWFVLMDPLLGLAAAGLLLLRRRWPVPITAVTTLMAGVSMVAVGAQSIILVSLATRRRWREILPLAGLTVLLSLVATRVVYPDPQPLPLWVEALVTLLIVAVTVAIGYSIGSRRALVTSWVDRARSAESEQRARVAQAQTAERTRIAREMHDVLAHRISLVIMHSGVLAYRPDLPDDERREAVAAIDSNARAALTDLRQVLGVLRDPEASGPLRPQSTLSDLPELVDGATSAGTRVTLDLEGVDPAAVPDSIGRTAYRVVQEGLTNARKHAPGAAVSIVVDGECGGELHVEIRNPRSLAAAPEAPVSGLGLLGLAERIDLAGGRMDHGWGPEGQYRLAVWLPWPA